MTTPRRVLLVGPAFHGYTSSIGRALQSLGHVVIVHEYDRHSTPWSKARRKIGVELPSRLGLRDEVRASTRRATEDAVEVLRTVRPHVVLAIKADALGTPFWNEAKGLGALTHLWLYDELHRTKLDPSVLERVDVLTSYSRFDAAALSARGLPSHHVANAFDTTVPVRPEPSRDVMFVGARYPNRQRLLLDLYARGVPVCAVGRDWSHHPVDRLRTWELRRPDLPNRRDVSRAVGYGLMAGALANVNVHFDQDGFTMRTFEIPGTGGVQLIDRPDVSDYYEPGSEVLVFTDVDEAEELVGKVTRDRAWAARIAAAGRARTLAEHTFVHRARDLETLWTA